MSDTDFERVVVVGTSGCGKTTFAAALARRLGITHVELDALHWGANWTPRADFIDAVKRAAAEPRWVMDGNYHQVRAIVWGRATAIVWLNFSFARVFSRGVWRTVRRGITREPLWAGNRESLVRGLFNSEAIPWWIIRTYARRRREYPALLRRPEYQHARVFELATPKAADAWLGELTPAPKSPTLATST